MARHVGRIGAQPVIAGVVGAPLVVGQAVEEAGREEIAGTGSFTLKAELGKGEAEHGH